MKTVSLSAFTFFWFIGNVLAQTNQQLVEHINSFWKFHQDRAIQIGNQEPAVTENQKIQLHLHHVIDALQYHTPKGFSKKQIRRRENLLCRLSSYTQAQNFPINTISQKRIPIFIDSTNNYCAVGYLMKESGENALCRDIQLKHNTGYLMNLADEFPAIKKWARYNGFELEELAWIQPTYSSVNYPYPCISSTPTNQAQVTGLPCDGTLTLGKIYMPSIHPLSGLPVTSAYIVLYGNAVSFPCDSAAPGNYIFKVYDSLANMAPILVSVPSSTTNFNPNLLLQPPSCYGACDGSITISSLTNTVGPIWYELTPGSWQVSNQFTGLCSTIYNLKIMDSLYCYSEFPVSLIAPNVLTITDTVQPDNGSGNGSISLTITGGNPPYHVIWNNSDTGLVITNLVAGTYSYYIQDSTNCTTSGLIHVPLYSPTNTSSVLIKEVVSLFPNPCRDEIHLRGTISSVENLILRNVYGQTFSTNLEQQDKQHWILSTQNLSAGLYFLFDQQRSAFLGKFYKY